MSIYLAGKVNGRKWHVIPNKKDFVSSDGGDHSEHEWGYSYWTFTETEMQRRVWEDAILPIIECEFLLAYLDRPTSFGSIAEIAYASAVKKKCFVVIKADDVSDEDRFNEWHGVPYVGDTEMHDAYWFVSNFPGVTAYHVTSEESARDIIAAILTKERRVPYSEYLRTPHWKATRKAAVERAGHKCQLCSRNGGTLNVHHNSYDNLWNEKEQDLIVLCRSCHSKYHNKAA